MPNPCHDPPIPATITPVARPIALLVEDNREYALIGTRLLENEGFDVASAPDGETGIRLARTRRPEVVLLDVSLPGIDGFEVCRRIREFSDAYVIMVTGRTDEVDRIVGLTVGADDYVTKPFSARELAARIGAMRRRPRAAAPTDALEFEGLSIDPNAREVRLDGQLLDLTKIEFDLLTKLASEPRRVFARQQLLDAIEAGRALGCYLDEPHLKTLPKGIKADPEWDFLLRYKGLVLRTMDSQFMPAWIAGPEAVDEVLERCRKLMPLIAWLHDL